MFLQQFFIIVSLAYLVSSTTNTRMFKQKNLIGDYELYEFSAFGNIYGSCVIKPKIGFKVEYKYEMIGNTFFPTNFKKGFTSDNVANCRAQAVTIQPFTPKFRSDQVHVETVDEIEEEIRVHHQFLEEIKNARLKSIASVLTDDVRQPSQDGVKPSVPPQHEVEPSSGFISELPTGSSYELQGAQVESVKGTRPDIYFPTQNLNRPIFPPAINNYPSSFTFRNPSPIYLQFQRPNLNSFYPYSPIYRMYMPYQNPYNYL